MGYYIGIPILFITVALQSSVVPQFRINAGQPDFVLLLVIAWAVHATLEEGLFWAFLGGILQDLLSSVPLGTSSITLVFMVFIAHVLARHLYKVNILWLIGLVIPGTVIQQIIVTVMLTTQQLGVLPAEMLELVLIPSLLYNMALCLPVYGMVRLLQHRIYKARPA